LEQETIPSPGGRRPFVMAFGQEGFGLYMLSRVYGSASDELRFACP